MTCVKKVFFPCQTVLNPNSKPFLFEENERKWVSYSYDNVTNTTYISTLKRDFCCTNPSLLSWNASLCCLNKLKIYIYLQEKVQHSQRLPGVHLIGCWGFNVFLPKDHKTKIMEYLDVCQNFSYWLFFPRTNSFHFLFI